MAIGLKYAGTCDRTAVETIQKGSYYHLYNYFRN